MNEHALSTEVLKEIFAQEISILYNAKSKLVDCLPKLIAQATFQNLKLALTEDLSDITKQLAALRQIFQELGRSALTEHDLGIETIIREASHHIQFNEENHYASDMSIIFYMNAIENLQIGACRIVRVITEKQEFSQFAQLIKESLDMNKDNAGLFKVIAKEYLGV